MQSCETNTMTHAIGDPTRIEARLHGVAFAPHRHDTYTFALTLKGVQRFDYYGATRNSLPGEIVVLHPDEIHDGRAGSDEAFVYRAIYIDPNQIRDVLGGTHPLPFVKGGMCADPRLARPIGDLLSDFSRPLAPLEYQTALVDLVSALQAVSGTEQSGTTANTAAAALARAYIHDHVERGITLDDLETATGRNRWQLCRDFRTLYGTSPYRYLLFRRLDRARSLIRSGLTFTEAASSSGFADQSHMTRHFKKAFGLSPGRWLALTAPA